ncbi:protein kinase domain-containing protein [Nocardia bovistercoris]|uniref:Protein kinase n=1 Tax=Nocardia bovistercoris TaxID=2785916 RepID=A0A931IDJ8_9NOCA|nr:protein kinase [Nocardia bovistercoris]MBH0778425.1 protein kinase [Nocardia bovistercoris]
MTEDDPLRTRREVETSLAAELSAVGFEDAVEIGRGGFGVVYRCRQAALDRTVAVKVMIADVDAENQERFLREQRAMGRLTGYPHIVTVLEAGATPDGHPYLAMPYHPSDSLDALIRKDGPLPLDKAVWVGESIAGALDSAHQLGIMHRDVKPGNILFTEHGGPALADFGIAHVAGGFRTATGIVTGSPAFTAPEVLEGGAPTLAADVYGLGATLFCALTGHAAFERRSGENVVTQFLRITSRPVPDLREQGIDAEVAAIVAAAMSRDPDERPTAAAVRDELGRIQRRRGFVTVASGEPQVDGARSAADIAPDADTAPDAEGNLSLELTSFIGRRTEVSRVRRLLSSSRLVTVAGIGGVGKTRVVLRAAAGLRPDFPDGVWVVELAEVSDVSLLVDVVAATLGVRDESAHALLGNVVEHLTGRRALLVLDNCEQVVVAAAELTETLLRRCPGLRMLIASREPLNIAGETVLRIAPLPVPNPDKARTLAKLRRFDSVTLFADRAAAAVPGFAVDEANKASVTRICSRLDGLPLAIELAAARMRTMSPEQILQRLDDRYTLLTRGNRTAPTRQQTLRWSIDWSYGLCTRAEQRLWARLSVFAGGFELDAAERICGGESAVDSVHDVLSALVDKSIVVREEPRGVVRFRMLETVREYGRDKLAELGERRELRRRHRHWYEQLALDAEAGWIGGRQLDWIARLEREQPNLREALRNCLSASDADAALSGLRTAAALYDFWGMRGLFGEGRSWIDRLLAHPAAAETDVRARVKAMCVGCQLAGPQGDSERAAVLLAQARALVTESNAAALEARIACADGILAFAGGDAERASVCLVRATDALDADETGLHYVGVQMLLGWAYEIQGRTESACERYERVVARTEAEGESLNRCAALRGLGMAAWQRGEYERAEQLLKRALRVSRQLDSPVLAALGLEALSWTAADRGDPERAVVLRGAATALWPSGADMRITFVNVARFHERWEGTVRDALGAKDFAAAIRRGRTLETESAVAYALDESPADTPPPPVTIPGLTPREGQVADLVARGLSNPEIADELSISVRTTQNHVRHILTKIGRTTRAQIATWVEEVAGTE